MCRSPGRLIAHASGRHGLAVLEPVVAKGALPLALHPVMTFTGRPEDAAQMAGISFGVTAPDALRAVAEVLVMEMGGEPVFIAEDKRGLYHAALASAANHLVTLVAAATDMLAEAGVAKPAAVLGPLLYAALDNALAARRRGAHRPGRPRRRRHRRRARRPRSRRRPPRRSAPTWRWPG